MERVMIDWLIDLQQIGGGIKGEISNFFLSIDFSCALLFAIAP